MIGRRAVTTLALVTLDVFEDRAAQRGRVIPLKVVVVAAKTPSGRHNSAAKRCAICQTRARS